MKRATHFPLLFHIRCSSLTHNTLREEHIKTSPAQCHSSFFKTTAIPPNPPKALQYPSSNPTHRIQHIQTTQNDRSIFNQNGLMRLQAFNATFNSTFNPTFNATFNTPFDATFNPTFNSTFNPTFNPIIIPIFNPIFKARHLQKMQRRVGRRRQLGRHGE